MSRCKHVGLEEAERSLHDALCVIRCLVKRKSLPLLTQLTSRALIAGGGAPEIEVAQALSKYSRTFRERKQFVFKHLQMHWKLFQPHLLKMRD